MTERLKETAGRLQKFVDDYVEDFETIVADADGREGYYQPNETERMLIGDAINGLCPGCGAPSGTHWGIRPGCRDA